MIKKENTFRTKEGDGYGILEHLFNPNWNTAAKSRPRLREALAETRHGLLQEAFGEVTGRPGGLGLLNYTESHKRAVPHRRKLSELAERVWAKANFIGLLNEAEGYRGDDYGIRIQHDAYGDRDNEYGWEIDHKLPVALGGSDDISNLRPLHWSINASKSDQVW